MSIPTATTSTATQRQVRDRTLAIIAIRIKPTRNISWGLDAPPPPP